MCKPRTCPECGADAIRCRDCLGEGILTEGNSTCPICPNGETFRSFGLSICGSCLGAGNVCNHAPDCSGACPGESREPLV